MAWPRMMWAVLTVGTALWGGLFVAAEPLYQITSCEVVHMDDACGRSLFAHFGVSFGLLASVPVALCAIPAVPGLRRCSWSVAAMILVASLSAATATDTVFGVLIYYLPVGLAALVAAALQTGHDRRRR